MWYFSPSEKDVAFESVNLKRGGVAYLQAENRLKIKQLFVCVTSI